MAHRQNKISRGTHTTCSEFGARVLDIASKVSGVRGISCGFLQKTETASATQRVKFTDLTGGILLSVRSAGSMQEIRVFCANIQDTRTAVARALRDNDIAICFR